MEEKKGISKNVLIGIIGVSILIAIVVIVSFIIFYNSPKKVKNEKADAGYVSMTYTDDEAAFSITNASPVTDSVGMSLSGADQYFDFTINTSILDDAIVEYEISLVKDSKNSNALDSNIKVYLEKQKSGTYVKEFGPKEFEGIKKKSDIGSPKGSMVIAKVSKQKDSTDNYRLRMWVSDKAVIADGALQNYTVKVLVKGKAK